MQTFHSRVAIIWKYHILPNVTIKLKDIRPSTLASVLANHAFVADKIPFTLVSTIQGHLCFFVVLSFFFLDWGFILLMYRLFVISWCILMWKNNFEVCYLEKKSFRLEQLLPQVAPFPLANVTLAYIKTHAKHSYPCSIQIK